MHTCVQRSNHCPNDLLPDTGVTEVSNGTNKAAKERGGGPRPVPCTSPRDSQLCRAPAQVAGPEPPGTVHLQGQAPRCALRPGLRRRAWAYGPPALPRPGAAASLSSSNNPRPGRTGLRAWTTRQGAGLRLRKSLAHPVSTLVGLNTTFFLGSQAVGLGSPWCVEGASGRGRRPARRWQGPRSLSLMQGSQRSLFLQLWNLFIFIKYVPITRVSLEGFQKLKNRI